LLDARLRITPSRKTTGKPASKRDPKSRDQQGPDEDQCRENIPHEISMRRRTSGNSYTDEERGKDRQQCQISHNAADAAPQPQAPSEAGEMTEESH
jgi:hypothetical protein